jgi:dUTPase
LKYYAEDKIKLLNDRAQMPQSMTEHSAGYDIFACPESDIVISSGGFTAVPAGFFNGITHWL